MVKYNKFQLFILTDLESRNNQVSSPGARKRIIVPPSSDSDSEIETQVKTHTETVIKNNYSNRFNGNKMKNPSILEKEKQMKFLLEIFPNLEAMVKYNIY